MAAAAGFALLLAGVLAVGPPGVDSAAHRFLTDHFSSDGWRFWDNYWYAGRYELVNYSLLFYPLAALVGDLPLVVASVAIGSGLFASLVMRQWGPPARWSVGLFALSWPALLLSGQYPFALGAVFALAALVAVQRRRSGAFLLATLAALLASPLAFLFLAVVLAGAVFGLRGASLSSSRVLVPLVALVFLGLLEVCIFRAFPTGGSFPYPVLDLVGVTAFSVCGLAFARGSEQTRALAGLFAVYLVLGWVVKLVPSALGGNVARLLDYGAAPLLALVIAVRGSRPRALVVVALTVAVAWQVVPLWRDTVNAYSERSDAAAFWQPALRFFDVPAHRDPNYRVEVVATWGHWESYYLAGNPIFPIQIGRGWFRQDDFPQNQVFYSGGLTARSYRAWLVGMGVRYVLLPNDKLDDSAHAEAALLRSGHSGLRLLSSFRSNNWRIYEVPDPEPILVPPVGSSASVRERTTILRVRSDGWWVNAPVAGTYVFKVRYTPFWRVDDPSAACITRGAGWTSKLHVERPGPVKISFGVSIGGAAAQAVGRNGPTCSVFPPLAPAS